MDFDLHSVKALGIAMSLAGLLAIIFLAPEPQNAKVSEISEKLAGKKLRVAGKATGVFISKGHAFFQIEDGASIPGIIFNATAEQMTAIRNSDATIFDGTVSIYNGKAELVVERIKKA